MLRRSALVMMTLTAATLVAAEIPKHVATTPVRQTDPEAEADWNERNAELNGISKQKDVRIAFIGDSITQMWKTDQNGKPTWKKYWEPLGAANFGISGDRTEHVLWRLDHGNLDGLSPKLIVLLIGTNNTGQQYESDDYICTPQQTADGVRAIISRLKTKCPGSKILLLAILPRGEHPGDRGRKQNTETNRLLAPLADSKTVFFLDIGPKFLKPDGSYDINIQPDTLHLSEKGYEIFAEAIESAVQKLMDS